MKTITINVPDNCEVKIVRKEEEKKEPVIRTYQDLIDNHKTINGYYIDMCAHIPKTCNTEVKKEYKDIATSEKIAKSMLAMAMISQLMPYYGGEITKEEWNDANMLKYVIKNDRGKTWTTYVYTIRDYLAFHTSKQRDMFLKYNKQLVKDYLMID